MKKVLFYFYLAFTSILTIISCSRDLNEDQNYKYPNSKVENITLLKDNDPSKYETKNIGQSHNELLAFMMKNHDISNFSTFDKYIEFQYDYLSQEYPELANFDKEEFVILVLSNLNSNNIIEFDYKKSLEITFKNAKDSEVISNNFYLEITKILNDKSINGNNIEEKIASIKPTNEYEKNSISYFLEVANYSQNFWNNTITSNTSKGRDWVVWGADAWGGAVAGIGGGALSANPVVGYLAGLAGSELMSAAVGAVR
jgi:hypothetical protein